MTRVERPADSSRRDGEGSEAADLEGEERPSGVDEDEDEDDGRERIDEIRERGGSRPPSTDEGRRRWHCAR